MLACKANGRPCDERAAGRRAVKTSMFVTISCYCVFCCVD